ncbi:hypothetical protein GGR55DRAFT_51023 [Xylaria sp. FL0064]|nr:hypothetical protein GGR55DRAFT_51023 [Xylaria sp. FL0064]
MTSLSVVMTKKKKWAKRKLSCISVTSTSAVLALKDCWAALDCIGPSCCPNRVPAMMYEVIEKKSKILVLVFGAYILVMVYNKPVQYSYLAYKSKIHEQQQLIRKEAGTISKYSCCTQYYIRQKYLVKGDCHWPLWTYGTAQPRGAVRESWTAEIFRDYLLLNLAWRSNKLKANSLAEISRPEDAGARTIPGRFLGRRPPR